MELKPFFTFYGGKWRAANHYPSPLHNLIVEPFAGAAGYSLRHSEKQIVLCDKDPVICALWRYLISANQKTILDLPDVREGQTLKEVSQKYGLSGGEESLIGFWLNKGTSSPCQSPSAWMRGGLRPKSFWGPEIRSRVSQQVLFIRHWTILEGTYADIEEVTATWFVDPPYQKAGRHYVCGSKDIDYSHLGSWSQSLQGQVVVCENEGADWLPFRPFRNIKANESKTGGKQSAEVIWTK